MEYEIIRSARKTIAVQIMPDGRVLVRCPRRMGREDIVKFVQSKHSWIEKHLSARAPALPKLSEAEIRELIRRAKQTIPGRVAHFAALVGVNYGGITIRRQRTRWGSCSAKGNLNFNCLLMLAPDRVLDYVVVHELCHRKEMNHSARFWTEVERVMPDYREYRAWLKEHGTSLIARLPEK